MQGGFLVVMFVLGMATGVLISKSLRDVKENINVPGVPFI